MARLLLATLVTASRWVLTGFQAGRMTLVFGCRRPDEDHLYREEMLEMAQNGVLHEVHTAYSRLPGQPKVNAVAAQAVGGALQRRLRAAWFPTSRLLSER